MIRIGLCLALAVVGCSKKSAEPAQHAQGVHVQKDPAQAKQLIANGATVLDVRTPDEYKDGHLEQATNLPIQGFDVGAVDKLVGGDKTKPVVVYCAKGGRAQKAKDALDAAGYTHVVNGGGYDDLR
jgi:phage shock protein E